MIEFNENGTELSSYVNYESFKNDLDRELMSEAESFVKVGYMLKVARDTNILTSSGYKTVFEFAKAEYGLDSTMVSRYIGINDTYSVNGYSEMLEDKYKGFGYAKLSEMLTLPPAIVEELEPDMTREEIRTIKKEYQEEKQISDIEVAIEAAAIIHKQQESEKAGVVVDVSEFEPCNDMQRLIFDFFAISDHAREYTELCGIDEKAIKELYEIIAPSGSRTIIGRVPGKGKMQLTIKGPEQKVALISYRTGMTEYYMWDDLAAYLNKLTAGEGEPAVKYTKIYNMDFAPAQIEPVKETTEPTKKEIPKDKPKPKKVEIVKKESAPKPPKVEEKLKIEEEPKVEVDPEPIPEKIEPEEKDEAEGIPRRAWIQRFEPYYKEYREFTEKASKELESIFLQGLDHEEINIRMCIENTLIYLNKALEEVKKIKDLPRTE